MRQHTKLKVLVVGWFGAGNLGDEAILYTELRVLGERIPDVEFTILSFDPERTRRNTLCLPGVRRILRVGSITTWFRSEFAKIVRAMAEVDALVIGGGGLFQDLYNVYPIPFFSAFALLARLLRKPVLFYCVGIGPIRRFAGRTLCRLAANSADLISVRDPESADLLRALGVTRRIHLAYDPAFLLSPILTGRVERLVEEHLHGPGPVIGVCVQNLLPWSGDSKRALAETLDELVRANAARIVFIPFGVYRAGSFAARDSDTVDVAATKELASMMTTASSMLPTQELSPPEIAAVITEMDLVISMRLHGLIMGLALGTPTIALTYRKESKIRNLMKRVGQLQSVFDVSSLSKDRLGERIRSLLRRRGDSSAELEASLRLRREAMQSHEPLIRRLSSFAPRTRRAGA